MMGLYTINSPGNAKNTLTVGAAQLRDVLNDNILLLQNKSTVASFSSIGPTFDGRLKPEIIAPGDYIMSAYAASSDILEQALSPDFNGPKSCSVHQMSGTSMATPITSGTALLIRQYFQDPKFWFKMCNIRYSSCINGPISLTGYSLKALILHAGDAVYRYSDPIYDTEPTFFSSFKLHSPPDVFQGFGQVILRNILPLTLENGQRDPAGLDPDLDLIVFNEIVLTQNSTIRLDVDMKAKNSDKHVTGNNLAPLKVTIAW
jgi:Subtilase family